MGRANEAQIASSGLSVQVQLMRGYRVVLSGTDQLPLLFPTPAKLTRSPSPWGGVGKFALEEQWFVQPFLQSSRSRGIGLEALGCRDALLPPATVSALCSPWGDSGQPFPAVPPQRCACVGLPALPPGWLLPAQPERRSAFIIQ